jgi:hypothetical protein
MSELVAFYLPPLAPAPRPGHEISDLVPTTGRRARLLERMRA